MRAQCLLADHWALWQQVGPCRLFQYQRYPEQHLNEACYCEKLECKILLLPLAVALASQDYSADPRVSLADTAIFLTNYEPIERLDPDEVLRADFPSAALSGKTILLDAAPEYVGAVAQLPSRQYATQSEITAQLLADVEQGQSVISPTWLRAIELLVPALLAIVAALFLPARNRRDVILLCTVTVSNLDRILRHLGRVEDPPELPETWCHCQPIFRRHRQGGLAHRAS